MSPGISPSRRVSGQSPARTPRSEASTPEPFSFSRGKPSIYRSEMETRKTVIPTLFITEPEDDRGATARLEEQSSRWVEVEEIIEFQVKKSPKPPRKRGTSPAKPEKDERGSKKYTQYGSRSRGFPGDDPNTNNSNNKLVEEAKASFTSRSYSEADIPAMEYDLAEETEEEEVEEDLNPQYAEEEEDTETLDSRALQESMLPTVERECVEFQIFEKDETVTSPVNFGTIKDIEAVELEAYDPDQTLSLEVEDIIIEEPEEQDNDELKSRDQKILTRDGKILTLEDLEDYVPGQGETYGCDEKVLNLTEDTPCEISVLQAEINEPTIGKPVLLNVGRPVVPKQRQSFFGNLKEGIGSMFVTGSRMSRMNMMGSSNVSYCMNQASSTGASASSSPAGQSTFNIKPSFCTEVQRSADNGQPSFKTEVSTRTLSYGTLGETVMVHITKKDTSQS